jgi:hypothetical protein
MKKRDIPERACAFCEKGKRLIDGENAICKHRGVVPLDFSCRRFLFDPLKIEREPRSFSFSNKIETLFDEEKI